MIVPGLDLIYRKNDVTNKQNELSRARSQVWYKRSYRIEIPNQNEMGFNVFQVEQEAKYGTKFFLPLYKYFYKALKHIQCKIIYKLNYQES